MKICLIMLVLAGDVQYPEFRVWHCRECWELARSYAALGFGVRPECWSER